MSVIAVRDRTTPGTVSEEMVRFTTGTALTIQLNQTGTLSLCTGFPTATYYTTIQGPLN
jgi:hypothetical protein